MARTRQEMNETTSEKKRARVVVFDGTKKLEDLKESVTDKYLKGCLTKIMRKMDDEEGLKQIVGKTHNQLSLKRYKMTKKLRVGDFFKEDFGVTGVSKNHPDMILLQEYGFVLNILREIQVSLKYLSKTNNQ